VFFLLVTGFNPAWFGHYGFLEDEGPVRQAGKKHLRCAPFGWCSERRLRSWPEDGACDVQTRAARCGEHGESRMVRPLCTNRMLPPRGTDARTGGPAIGPADRSLLSSADCGTDAGAATAATG
jgi:hypothetical protein